VPGLADAGQRRPGHLFSARRAAAPLPADDGRDRSREEHDRDHAAAHRADPTPPGRRRWVSAAGAARRQGRIAGLTGHLFLDASPALVELTPLPLLITANAAVGKRWAGHAAEILSGVAGGLITLLGIADLAGAHILVQASGSAYQLALDWTVIG